MGVELLAPAGNWDALVAAVQNGADAIYAGGTSFSARAYAQNFDRDVLKKAIDYCHLYGKKLYMTVNTLVDDEELRDMVSYAVDAYKMGVDAFIVQDLGAARVMLDMGLPVHASTQMTVHNTEGVKFLQHMGFKRVVLARELSLDEIKDIVANTSLEIEVFVHGALCVSYSGQCLLSSFIGGRSGNRGRCAQPCRKLYQLINGDKAIGDFCYILSMKDLNTINWLQEIVGAGVTSLKVEGRMKRPEYVATVIRAYRSALDGTLSEQDCSDLECIFNREFTPGYIMGDSITNVVNTKSPKNQGVYVGKLLSVRKRIGDFMLERPVSVGDGIGIGPTGFTVSVIFKNGRKVEKAVGRVEIPLPTTDVKPGNVYKTFDVALVEKARKSYEDMYGKKIEVRARAEIKLDNPMRLAVWDDTHTVKVTGTVKAEKAIKKPIEPERIKEQIQKTGNMPYIINYVDVDTDEGVILPVREINGVRRKALEELTLARCSIKAKTIKEPEYWEDPATLERETTLYAKVKTVQDVNKAIEAGIDGIYFQSMDVDEIERALDLCQSEDVIFAWALPYITRNEVLKDILAIGEKLAHRNLNRVVVSNIGLIGPLRDMGFALHGDYNFNVFNSQTACLLRRYGLELITLSPELRLSQIKRIFRHMGGKLMTIIYGYIPAMITPYDPVKKILSFKKSNKGDFCDYKPKSWGIKDQTGAIFPVEAVHYGDKNEKKLYTVIYNSRPLFMADKIGDILDAGVRNLRLDFIEENENVYDIIRCYKACLNGDFGCINVIRDKIPSFTRGHFYKGVE